MATLYIVATPIGNLEDITLRALRILKEADVILCEDTRVTQKLLKHYGIADKQLSTWNEERSSVSTGKVFAWLREGKNIALVSDSGTPSISDPGGRLVAFVKQEFGNEVAIVAIPGPSALTGALSVSGLPASDFLFLGFLPHKKGRETLFKEIEASQRTVVLYESPHRILKSLTSLEKILGSERVVVVARELTKVFEELVSGTPGEVLAYFTAHADKVRGEFVVMVSGKK